MHAASVLQTVPLHTICFKILICLLVYNGLVWSIQQESPNSIFEFVLQVSTITTLFHYYNSPTFQNILVTNHQLSVFLSQIEDVSIWMYVQADTCALPCTCAMPCACTAMPCACAAMPCACAAMPCACAAQRMCNAMCKCDIQYYGVKVEPVNYLMQWIMHCISYCSAIQLHVQLKLFYCYKENLAQ